MSWWMRFRGKPKAPPQVLKPVAIRTSQGVPEFHPVVPAAAPSDCYRLDFVIFSGPRASNLESHHPRCNTITSTGLGLREFNTLYDALGSLS